METEPAISLARGWRHRTIRPEAEFSHEQDMNRPSHRGRARPVTAAATAHDGTPAGLSARPAKASCSGGPGVKTAGVSYPLLLGTPQRPPQPEGLIQGRPMPKTLVLPSAHNATHYYVCCVAFAQSLGFLPAVSVNSSWSPSSRPLVACSPCPAQDARVSNC